MGRVLLFLVIMLLCSTMAVAERTETDRATGEFWQQFKTGDSQINVYTFLRRLILVYTNEANQSTILQWDGTCFTLFLRNREIADLVTGQDQWGRPTFAGSFEDEQPAVTGFVDLTPDGELLVQIAEISPTQNPTMRFSTSDDGSVDLAYFRECACVGNNLAECVAADCDTKSLCTGDPAKRCDWVNAYSM